MPQSGHYSTKNTVWRSGKVIPAVQVGEFKIGRDTLEKTEGICLGSSAVWLAETLASGSPPTSLNLYRASMVQAATYSRADSAEAALRAVNIDNCWWTVDLQNQEAGQLVELLATIPDGKSALFGISRGSDGTGHMMAVHRGANRYWVLDPNDGISWFTDSGDYKQCLSDTLNRYKDLFPANLCIRGVSS
jgi:hypothetical protein